MKDSRPARSKVAMTLALALTGGTVFSACETRLKEIVVAGSTDYLYALLDPTTVAGLFVESDDTESDGD